MMSLAEYYKSRKQRRVEMSKAIKAGNSVIKVANSFDCSEKTVRTACAENGVFVKLGKVKEKPLQ